MGRESRKPRSRELLGNRDRHQDEPGDRVVRKPRRPIAADEGEGDQRVAARPLERAIS
jgi:hypothetical protein